MGKKLISFALTASKKQGKGKFIRDRTSQKYLNLSLDKSGRFHIGLFLQDSAAGVWYSVPVPASVLDLIIQYIRQYKELTPLSESELKRLRVSKTPEIDAYIKSEIERAKKRDYGFKRDSVRGGAVLDKQLYVTFRKIIKGGMAKEQLNELILNACQRELEKQFNKALYSQPTKPVTTMSNKPAQPPIINKCEQCGVRLSPQNDVGFCDNCLSEGF